MKLSTRYSVLLFCCMILSSALLANDNYDINNISEEFISTYITGPLSHLDTQGRSAVSTGSGCSITITKVGTHNDANSDGLVQEGETITYTFTVCNDGTEDLFNVTVNDPLSPVAGSLAVLSAMTGSGTAMTGSGTGITCDSDTFSTTYTVDAGDAASGFVSNTATVQSFDINGNPVMGFSNTVVFPVSSRDVIVDNPSVTLFKSGTFTDENGDGFAQAGETISYAFEVCNDGNLDLFDLTVNDGLVNVNGTLGTLIATPGNDNCNTTTFSAIYTITNNDIANAQVVNVATVSGTDENGNSVIAVSNTSVVALMSEPIDGGGTDPSLSLSKEGVFNDENGDGFASIGETITYFFEVCNTGDDPITNISVFDPIASVTTTISLINPRDCNSTLTSTYVLAQTDISNGQVLNIATVAGTASSGATVVDTSDDPTNSTDFDANGDGEPDDPTITTYNVDTTISNPELSILKVGTFSDENNDGFAQVGETVTYTFTVCNEGNEDIFDIEVLDPLVDVSGSSIDLFASTGSGTSCDASTFTAMYTINANDIANAQVVNIATVIGIDDNGDDVASVSNISVVTLDTEPIEEMETNPSLELTKVGVFNDEDGDGFASIGETITYFFEVCNTGDDPITNISVLDPIAPVTSTIALINPRNCNSSLTSTYTLTQTDITIGEVLNIAIVSGSDSAGATIVDTSDDPNNPTNFDVNGDGEPDDPTITTYNIETVISNATISIQKVGTFSDENNDGFVQVGETITYTFTVCNEGNEDLFNIEIVDPLVNVSGSPINLLASTNSTPSCNESTFSASYTINANDIVNGQVTNIAYARGFDSAGAIVIDYSDDPFNNDDFDQNGDGDADDPTVTEFVVPPVVELSTIGNFVWEDLNGNGIQDFGEPGIANVFVGLYNQLDALVAITTTDANGFYLFEDVIPGEYYLSFGDIDGYELTFANTGGSDLADSDVDGSNGASTTASTTLSPGETDLTWDAGFYRCIPMGELVWYDVNQNNRFDQGENGLNGIKVHVYRLVSGGYELYDIQFTGHKPDTPSDDGYWKMCVPPGSYYVSYIIPPFGLVTARPNVGSNELADSDVTDAFGPGTTNTYVVKSGDEQCDIGAGYYPQATLGDRVWYDVNRNGVQDISEPGAGGITVKVHDLQGNVVNELITDADGDYTADYLRDAEYFIEVTPPLGYVATSPNASTDDMDSDIDHTFGANTTPAFRTLPGNHTPHVDAGLVSSFILSADWLSVEAERENGLNTVTWTVANDIEVHTYTVERKLGNTGFFAAIGNENALNQDNSMTYSLRDIDSVNDGEYFYRVKMDMYDGSINYSDIVYVNVTEAEALDNVASIYPNPAINDVTLTIKVSENDSDISITILNQLGQIVLNDEILGTSIDAGTHQYNLDVSSYGRGSYVIELLVGSQRTVKKMVLVE